MKDGDRNQGRGLLGKDWVHTVEKGFGAFIRYEECPR